MFVYQCTECVLFPTNNATQQQNYRFKSASLTLACTSDLFNFVGSKMNIIGLFGMRKFTVKRM